MSSKWLSELLILQKWRDSSTPIKLRLVSSNLSMQGWATVVVADDDRVALDFDGGAGFITFDPSTCKLEFGDSLMADVSVREDIESKLEGVVTVAVAHGLGLQLYGYKVSE